MQLWINEQLSEAGQDLYQLHRFFLMISPFLKLLPDDWSLTGHTKVDTEEATCDSQVKRLFVLPTSIAVSYLSDSMAFAGCLQQLLARFVTPDLMGDFLSFWAQFLLSWQVIHENIERHGLVVQDAQWPAYWSYGNCRRLFTGVDVADSVADKASTKEITAKQTKEDILQRQVTVTELSSGTPPPTPKLSVGTTPSTFTLNLQSILKN